MTLRARSCVAALLFVGLALYTESAQADAAAGAPAPPTCKVSLGSTKSGVTLPANAPALLVVDQSYGGAGTPTLSSALVNGTTRTELAAVTDTHGLTTLALPTPSLAPGAYSIEVNASCPDISDEQDTVTPLTLTAPVALPSSVGTLVHVPSNPPTGVDKIRLEPTDGMRAFLPAAQLELVVAGTKSAKLTLLGGTASPIELTVNTGDACIENGALHRDKRIVKVTLEGAIAGVAESPAAASIDVPIDCGAIKWTSGLDLDGDGVTDPPGSTGSSGSSGASGSGGTTYTSSPASDGGCSASPVGTHGASSGLLAFALAGVAVAIRRRRAR